MAAAGGAPNLQPLAAMFGLPTNPAAIRQNASDAVRRRFQALGREAASDPFSIVAHVIGGVVVGGAAWAIAHAVDYDETTGLELAEEPPVFFGYTPEVTTAFLEFQGFVNRQSREQIQWFREAIKEADALFALEFGVMNSEIEGCPARVTDANGHVSRTLGALRNIRDEQITEAKFQSLNRKIADLTSLLYTHVTNVRTCSMSAGPRGDAAGAGSSI